VAKEATDAALALPPVKARGSRRRRETDLSSKPNWRSLTSASMTVRMYLTQMAKSLCYPRAEIGLAKKSKSPARSSAPRCGEDYCLSPPVEILQLVDERSPFDRTMKISTAEDNPTRTPSASASRSTWKASARCWRATRQLERSSTPSQARRQLRLHAPPPPPRRQLLEELSLRTSKSRRDEELWSISTKWSSWKPVLKNQEAERPGNWKSARKN